MTDKLTTQPDDEAAFLRSQIALALEEMSCANFNSAAERLRHCAEVTQYSLPADWVPFQPEDKKVQAKPEQAAQPWECQNFWCKPYRDAIGELVIPLCKCATVPSKPKD